MNNNAVAEAIGEELELSNRLSRAKSNAITNIVNAGIVHGQTHVHGFDVAGAIPLLQQTAEQMIDHAMSKFDVEGLIIAGVARADYMTGIKHKSNPAQLAASTSPETRVALAEGYLAKAAEVIAGALIANIDRSLEVESRP